MNEIKIAYKNQSRSPVSAFIPHAKVRCQLSYITPKNKKSSSETEMRETFNERHL